MLLIIIFLLLGVILFMTMNTRKDLESVKRTRKTTVLVDRNTGEVLQKKQVVDEFDDEDNDDFEQRENVVSKLWDKIK